MTYPSRGQFILVFIETLSPTLNILFVLPSFDSISIAEKLKNCNEKPWFKEIIQLKKEILKTLNQKIKIDIRKILAEAFSKGNENLIKYLLKMSKELLNSVLKMK